MFSHVTLVEGTATLRTDEGALALSPGMCAGFRAGTGNAHHLVNESAQDVVYLEVGDRTPGDSAIWPDDDLQIIDIAGKKPSRIVTARRIDLPGCDAAPLLDPARP